jgi:hypothetical protein
LINLFKSHIGHTVFFFSNKDRVAYPKMCANRQKIISEITFNVVSNTIVNKQSWQLK